MDTISTVFDLLDQWRHLPSYQLERRADIFFALYLVPFLQDRFKVALKPQLVPEFPVHLGTIYPENPINASCKIDYLAVSEDRSTAFFVELKTDSASRRDEQDCYLAAAQKAGLPALVRGIIQIATATHAKRKYAHLLMLLEKAGLLRLPETYRRKIESGSLRGIGEDLARIEVRQDPCRIRIVYLQPQSSAENELGFAQLADWLERFDDPISSRFRESLRRWAACCAGEGHPLLDHRTP